MSRAEELKRDRRFFQGRGRRERAKPAIERMESRQLLSTAPVLFDVDGPGPAAARLIQGFDFRAGNVLAQGVVPTTVGATFPVIYQTTLDGVIGADGKSAVPPGLNATFEITAVAKLTAVVTESTPNSLKFRLAPEQPAESSLRMFYDSKRNADPLAGTGFDDGTGILRGAPDSSLGFDASEFTYAVDGGGNQIVELLDQFGGDNLAGQNTARGTGSWGFGSLISEANASFFRDPVDVIRIQGDLKTPFTSIDPATRFSGGVVPALGAVNGQNGPDVQFESKATASIGAIDARMVVVKAVNGQDASQPPGPITQEDAPLDFSYVVTNPGNVGLGTVRIRDDNGTPSDTKDDFTPIFLGGDTNGDQLLNPGETWSYSDSRTALRGQIHGTVQVTGQDIRRGRHAGGADATYYFGNSPLITITKLINGQHVDSTSGLVLAENAAIDFTYQVTSAALSPLTGVLVVDDNGTPFDATDDFSPVFTGGDLSGDGKLDFDETWTYAVHRQAIPGPHLNIAQASAVADGKGVVAADVAGYTGQGPAIAVRITTNGVDADQAPGVVVPVGSQVEFIYILTNPGTAPLANVVVVDDDGQPNNPAGQVVPVFLGGDTNADTRLDPTETWTYTAMRAATVGQYTNTATATGVSTVDGRTVSAKDTSNSFGSDAKVTLAKTVAGTGGAVVNNVFNIATGAAITFTYTLTNAGTIAIGNVVVRDDNATPLDPADDFIPELTVGDTNTNGVLDAGEVWIFTKTAIALAGDHKNTATVEGTDPSFSSVTATGTAEYFGTTQSLAVAGVPVGYPPPLQVGLVQRDGSGEDGSILIRFTLPLDASTAFDVSNYTVTTPGRDRRFGTRDDRGVFVAGAEYDDATRTVRIFTDGAFPGGTLRLRLNGSTASALRSSFGTPLDGEYNTVPGGDFVGLVGPSAAAGAGQVGALTDTAGAVGPIVLANTPLTLGYVVANNGNAAVSGLSIRDDNGTPFDSLDDAPVRLFSGDTNSNSVLDPGETWLFQAIVPAGGGQRIHTAVLSGTDSLAQPFTQTIQAAYFGIFPNVVQFVRTGNSEFRMTYSGPLDPLRVLNRDQYILKTAGRDGVLGTRDDIRVRFRSARYNPRSRQVILTAASALDPARVYRFKALSPVPGGAPFQTSINGADASVRRLRLRRLRGR